MRTQTLLRRKCKGTGFPAYGNVLLPLGMRLMTLWVQPGARDSSWDWLSWLTSLAWEMAHGWIMIACLRRKITRISIQVHTLKKGLVVNNNKKMIVMCESSLENIEHLFVKPCVCACVQEREHGRVCALVSTGVLCLWKSNYFLWKRFPSIDINFGLTQWLDVKAQRKNKLQKIYHPERLH